MTTSITKSRAGHYWATVRDDQGRIVVRDKYATLQAARDAVFGAVNGHRAEAIANAAAPELLAALCELTGAVECAYEAIYEALPDGPMPDWFLRLHHATKQGRAAIAKATGA